MKTPVLKLKIYDRIRTAIYLEVERIDKAIKDPALLTDAQVLALCATAGVPTIGKVVGDEIEIRLVITGVPKISYVDEVGFQVDAPKEIYPNGRYVTAENTTPSREIDGPKSLTVDVVKKFLPPNNAHGKAGAYRTSIGELRWYEFNDSEFRIWLNDREIQDWREMNEQQFVDLINALGIEVTR